ncbi:MAG: hypothetical protein ACOCXT_06520 [Candidatus Dojkabacteria bacterium]
MRYLTNHEVAEMYKVSERTVGNWIDYAIEEKVDLQLVHEDQREYILNTNHNHIILTDLSYKSRKYKSKKLKKTIKPKDEFYKIFNEDQIIELINSIESYREIPHKFTYFDEGAKYWDRYVNKLAKESNPNALNNNILLLEKNFEYLLSLIQDYKKVNVVDLGSGNGLPVKSFIQKLINLKLLNKYIIVDYSKDMAKIAVDNMRKWFGDDISIEEEYLDLIYSTFQKTLFVNSNQKDGEEVYANIVILFGDTPANQRLINLPFVMLNNSMNATSDILLYSEKLDTKRSRMYFDFASSETNYCNLDEQERIILDLLNISEDIYEVEAYYDEKEHSRFTKISLKFDINIKFELHNFTKTIILLKGDKIITWRGKHQNYTEVMNMMDSTGFNVLHTSRSLDQEQLLVISKVKSV